MLSAWTVGRSSVTKRENPPPPLAPSGQKCPRKMFSISLRCSCDAFFTISKALIHPYSAYPIPEIQRCAFFLLSSSCTLSRWTDSLSLKTSSLYNLESQTMDMSMDSGNSLKMIVTNFARIDTELGHLKQIGLPWSNDFVSWTLVLNSGWWWWWWRRWWWWGSSCIRNLPPSVTQRDQSPLSRSNARLVLVGAPTMGAVTLA